MKSGYKILWTDHTLGELEKTIKNLETNFTKKELEKISQKIESIVSLIFTKSPPIFEIRDERNFSGYNFKIQYHVLPNPGRQYRNTIFLFQSATSKKKKHIKPPPINIAFVSSAAGVPFLHKPTSQPAHADAAVFNCITAIVN